MGLHKIVWSKQAQKRFLQILIWYKQERGNDFANKFYKGIYSTIDTIASMPTIGTIYKTSDNRTYYSFLSHPSYRIVYRFTKNTLYIVAIRATAMQE